MEEAKDPPPRPPPGRATVILELSGWSELQVCWKAEYQ